MTEESEENSRGMDEKQLKEKIIERLEEPEKLTVMKRIDSTAYKEQMRHRIILIGLVAVLAGILYWKFL